jgi:hypothetical protein
MKAAIIKPEKLIEMAEGIASLNAKLDALSKRLDGDVCDFKDHIKEGQNWRRAILGVAATSISGIVLTVLRWNR